MATITFNTAHQKAQIREQLDAVIATFHQMLDAFVSNRMRRAAEAGYYVRPRPGAPAEPADMR